MLASLHNLTAYSFYIKIGGAVCIFLLFILLRKVMHTFILNFFKKKISRVSELLEDITTALERPIDFLWLIIGTQLALLSSPFVKFTTITQPELVLGDFSLRFDIIPADFLNKVFGIFVIIGLTWIGFNFVDVYEKLLLRMGTRFTLLDNALIIRFTAKLIKFTVVVVGVCCTVAFLIPIGSILTSVGILGAAITFIAKDTLTNIMSGVVLMIDSPFTIGDWIALSDIEGIVEDVSFRSTRIRTFEQGLIVIPNATLANDNILNWSTMPKRRHRFELGVSYNTSKDTMEAFVAAIKEALPTIESIEQESLLIYFDSFGDYSLNIIIQYFTTHTDLMGYTAIKEEVNLKLMELASQYSVEIAFPTQTLYVNTPVTSH